MGRLIMWNLMTPLFKPGAPVKLALRDARPLSKGVVINRYVPRP
jgi:hypothetical protein